MFTRSLFILLIGVAILHTTTSQNANTKCTSGSYYNAASRTCAKCHLSCATCSNEGRHACLTCPIPTTLQQDNSCAVIFADVNGGWSDWTVLSCSVTCGNGIQNRARSCTNPPPSGHGSPCIGVRQETVPCTTAPCGSGWGAWSLVGSCSVTCGIGLQTFRRQCLIPSSSVETTTTTTTATTTTTSVGRMPCNGDAQKSEQCTTDVCKVPTTEKTDPSTEKIRPITTKTPQTTAITTKTPGRPINGVWSDWLMSGSCSVTCGTGRQTYIRTCSSPPPANGGKPCSGSANKTMQCTLDVCKINGGWSIWYPTGSCSVTCGSGMQAFSRTCDNPLPSGGGQKCPGNTLKFDPCTVTACSSNGAWSAWSTSGPCSVTCGSGQQTYTRTCSNPAPSGKGKPCQGNEQKTDLCAMNVCSINGSWSSWSPIGQCSVSCGTGQQLYIRECSNPPPSGTGRSCTGRSEKVDPCTVPGCKIDGGWSAYTPGRCNVTCGTGYMQRTRTCNNPEPSGGGKPCVGSAEHTVTCSVGPCPK